MTTMSDYEAILAPALDAYAARLREHSIDYSHREPRTHKRGGGYTRCTCGRTFRNANGLGIHRAAADKRAAALYDVEAAELMAAARCHA